VNNAPGTKLALSHLGNALPAAAFATGADHDSLVDETCGAIFSVVISILL
jgi:hypothetical protein